MITFKQFISEAKEKKIGKLIGGDLYLHKDYEHQLPQDELKKAKEKLPKDFQYTAVKHNKKEGTFSFIHSPDFDAANEPTVGDSIKVHPDGTTKLTKQSNPPKIWHHKHQWVADDYKGFDVEASKRRSEEWKPHIKEGDSARIGNRTYWHGFLEKNGLKP